MRRDLTPREREEEKVLQQELKGKKQEAIQSGDDNAYWTIRQKKVVNVGSYPAVGQDH